MIKIRDTVKLEELEKFEFIDDDKDGLFKYWVGNTQLLTINKWNGLIKVTQLLISPNGEKRKVSKDILDKLYDLITAGLVEKV